MKVYLDDIGLGTHETLGDRWYEWVIVRTVENCNKLIAAGIVTELSLDYSLSDTDPYHTGLDVLQFILDKLLEGDFDVPYITIHSKHSGADKMHAMLKEIKQNTITLVDINFRTPDHLKGA